MFKYKAPLSIYVIWHPNFENGLKYANHIYKAFCRDYDNPLARNIGIPVFYRSTLSTSLGKPLPINYDESDRNAMVILIDEELFNDAVWSEYILEVVKSTNNNNRVIPIAMSQYAYYLDEQYLSKYQFVQAEKILNDNKDIQFQKRWNEIKTRLLHDFARFMKNMDSVSEIQSDSLKAIPPPPVKLFISHAKKDGLQLAIRFRDYIESSTKLNTFFDANDIADGYDFEDQIKSNIDKDTALVVFHTDEYSNREWCRIEVLTAKRHKCPIVVVLLIEKGELRSFPYLGNVPTIKWRKNFDEVINLALIQVLNNLYGKLVLQKYTTMYNLEKKYNCIELTSPPELFNYLDIEKVRQSQKGTKKEVLVIYKDPPLGYEELRILNEIDSKIHFTTPSHLFKYYHGSKD